MMELYKQPKAENITLSSSLINFLSQLIIYYCSFFEMSGANVEFFYTNDAKGDYYKYIERRKLISNQKQ